MSDLVNKLHDQHISARADASMDREKYQIAVAACTELSDMLLKNIKTQVEDFGLKFGVGLLELRIPDHTGYDMRVRTQRFPLRTMRYKFGAARLDYVKEFKATHDAPLEMTKGTVLVQSDFNQICWYQHQGKKLMTTDDLADMLLLEVFEQAANPTA